MSTDRVLVVEGQRPVPHQGRALIWDEGLREPDRRIQTDIVVLVALRRKRRDVTDDVEELLNLEGVPVFRKHRFFVEEVSGLVLKERRMQGFKEVLGHAAQTQDWVVCDIGRYVVSLEGCVLTFEDVHRLPP